MTESKEDIQAQIDGLNAEWERECEPLMIQEKGRNSKRAPEAITRELVMLTKLSGVLFVLWFTYHLYEYWTYTSPEWIEGDVPYDDWGGLFSSFLLVLSFPLTLKSVNGRNARYDRYMGLKQSYKSKRAEFQAKLDSFNEGEGS